MIKLKFTLAACLIGLLSDHLAAAPGWGTDQITTRTTITLDINNEPLRSVLGKMTRKTNWKIKIPEQWLDRPVTQSLHQASLEEGLRSVLNNAGADNLLLMYDERFKIVTVFAISNSPATDRSNAQPIVQPHAPPPVTVANPATDPALRRTVIDARQTPARMNRRLRRQLSEDD